MALFNAILAQDLDLHRSFFLIAPLGGPGSCRPWWSPWWRRSVAEWPGLRRGSAAHNHSCELSCLPGGERPAFEERNDLIHQLCLPILFDQQLRVDEIVCNPQNGWLIGALQFLLVERSSQPDMDRLRCCVRRFDRRRWFEPVLVCCVEQRNPHGVPRDLVAQRHDRVDLIIGQNTIVVRDFRCLSEEKLEPHGAG